MKKQLRSRSLGGMMVESLEMSAYARGQCHCALVSGVLQVNGDNKSNDVHVGTTGSATFVQPVPGTTVNGGTATVVFAGFPDVNIEAPATAMTPSLSPIRSVRVTPSIPATGMTPSP